MRSYKRFEKSMFLVSVLATFAVAGNQPVATPPKPEEVGMAQCAQAGAVFNMTVTELKALLRQGIRTETELDGIIDNRWQGLFREILSSRQQWLLEYSYHRLRAGLIAKAAIGKDPALLNRLRVFYYSGDDCPDSLSQRKQIEICASLLTHWPNSFTLHLKEDLPSGEWRVTRDVSYSHRTDDSVTVDVRVAMGMTADAHSISFKLLETAGAHLWIPTGYEWKKGPYEFDGELVGGSSHVDGDRRNGPRQEVQEQKPRAELKDLPPEAPAP